MRLVVLSEDQKKTILQECHNNPGTGNHSGVRATRDKVVAGSDAATDVSSMTQSKQCPLHPIKVKEPWAVLGMDLIGPLKPTERSHMYVLTITDLYTKWVMAEPLQTASTVDVATALVGKLYLFGMVKKIISDRGREFVNEACSNIERAQAKQKKHFEAKKRKRVRKCLLEAGDDVLIGETPLERKKGNSLQNKHKGPFTLTSVTNKGVATVRVEGKIQKMNVSHLRPYLRPKG
ncbi:hypothetical protein ACEWY4_007653 [Coilia grayii]|uniref:Integrase catalytic domain-containing protein n=1 Tax=Coilia grayii TaxID=363190 RepID=A0ABD1KHH3_9TELE